MIIKPKKENKMNTPDKELLETLKMFVTAAGYNSSTKSWTIGPMADVPGGKMDIAQKLIRKYEDNTKKEENKIYTSENDRQAEKTGLDDEYEKIASAHRNQLKLHRLLESMYGFETPAYDEMRSKISQYKRGQLIVCGVCHIYPLGKEGSVLFFNDGENTMITTQGNLVTFKDINYPNGPRGEWIKHAIYEIEKQDYTVNGKEKLLEYAQNDIEHWNKKYEEYGKKGFIDVDKKACEKEGVPVEEITSLVRKYSNKKSKAQVLSIYDSKNYKTRVAQNMVNMDSSKTEIYDILIIDVASLVDDGQERKTYISKAGNDDYVLLANGESFHCGFADFNKSRGFTVGTSWGDQDNFDKVVDHLGVDVDKISKIVDEVNNNVVHLNCRDIDLLNELKKESNMKVPSMLDKLRSPECEEDQGIKI